MSSAIDLMRVIFGLSFLCYASYTDLKTRRVKNQVWMLMGFTGGVFLLLQLFLDKRGWEYYLILVPVSILYASMFIEQEPLYDKDTKAINFKLFGLYIIGILVILYQLFALYGETYFYKLLAIPILIIFFFVLYQLRILHGGADAKAMMAIAILMPFYPNFFNFPIIQLSPEKVASTMELFFPFAFLVLMNSVLFVIWAFLAFLVYNTAKRDFGFPEMLLGYKMDIGEVERKYVWSMERIVEGEKVMVLFPKRNDDDSLEKLKELGVKRIWVTPKIPFILFLTFGFVISAFIGNLFVGIIGLFS
jgi:preflagellin peptidase FlaK